MSTNVHVMKIFEIKIINTDGVFFALHMVASKRYEFNTQQDS